MIFLNFIYYNKGPQRVKKRCERLPNPKRCYFSPLLTEDYKFPNII
jgi:hypothetical protein